jgi:hypothetical protein
MIPLLSIMLPTTTDRRKTFYQLLELIMKQINKLDASGLVEILIDEDNKEKSIGKKRQDLLERATGKYVVGIDSDDSIAIDYLESILDVIKVKDVDHVGFLEACKIDGESSTSIFSVKYKFWEENKDGYDHIRCANPKSVIKREKALLVGYEDLRYGEDRKFSETISPILQSEVFINKFLYYYIYNKTSYNERYGIK